MAKPPEAKSAIWSPPASHASLAVSRIAWLPKTIWWGITVTFFDYSLKRQMLWGASAIILGAALLGSGAYWAASRIDENVLIREQHLASIGVDEVADRVVKEQDGSTIWDDALLAARANDTSWLADNLVEWLGDFYGHEYVVLLDPSNRPMQIAQGGGAAEIASYTALEATIAPIVTTLREEMNAASAGLTDSNESITGLGQSGFVKFPDRSVGLVSIRPILSDTGELKQRPGDEFLHVSVEMVNRALVKEIADRFGLTNLQFRMDQPATAASLPITGRDGSTVGWLEWQTEHPALRLLQNTLPAVFAALALAVLFLIAMLKRLHNTSRSLRDTEQKARRLAFHDHLTGLPNRALFEDRLEQAAASAHEGNATFALYYLDLDQFKYVNDTRGHPVGDELIRQVAARLLMAKGKADTVARLGGDEFAVIQAKVTARHDAEEFAAHMLEQFEPSFDLFGEEARIGVSIGGVIAEGAVPPDDLMRTADIALYEAKGDGRGRFRLFTGSMDEKVRQRRALDDDLRSAIDTKEGLHLVYQPIHRANGEMAGVEALARWTHPVHGPIGPDLFIALAEERGSIEQLGNWVINTACDLAVRLPLPWIAINVSPLQLRDPFFANRLLALLSARGIEPARLQIEMTEGVLLQGSPTVKATINQLRSAGVRVALDDFGTGYSSITYLRDYGIDKLKIDKSFVDKLGHDEESASIVAAIIDLAQAMKMTITAEGVETELQASMLRRMGVTELQGYLLSRPLMESQVVELVQPRKRARKPEPHRSYEPAFRF